MWETASCGPHSKISESLANLFYLRVSCKSFLLCILKAQLLLVYFVFTVTAPSERFYLYKRMEIQVAAEAVSRQEEDDLLRAVMRNRLSVS